ncbi:uncharacterized protein LOC134966455 isoform X1 [Pseudophryne corroboree]|uniref:uncharacterized protein LOC134966455 isoform X1 n=1 Tax=Pseudophryne corroboree TaxID=495146 RepID=UPI003081D109
MLNRMMLIGQRPDHGLWGCILSWACLITIILIVLECCIYIPGSVNNVTSKTGNVTFYNEMLFKTRVCRALQKNNFGGEFTGNSMIAMHSKIAKALNTSKCWICTHLPIRVDAGIPLLAHYISTTDMIDRDWSCHKRKNGSRICANKTPKVQNIVDFPYLDVSNRGLLHSPALQVTAATGRPEFCLNVNSKPGKYTLSRKKITVRVKRQNLGYTNCTGATFVVQKSNKCTLTNLKHCWHSIDTDGVLTSNDTLDQLLRDGCTLDNSTCRDVNGNNTGYFMIYIGIIYTKIFGMPLPKGMYWVCGKWAYSWIPLGAKGQCVLSYVVPLVRATTKLDQYPRNIPVEHDLVSSDLTNLRQHSKREVRKGDVSFRFSDGERTAGTLFPLSTIYLVEKAVSQTLTVLDQMVGELEVSINQTVEELAQVRKVALQNRMVLDQLLAAEGGTCAVVGQECCTYIEDHRAEIGAHQSKVGELQQEMRRLGASGGWDPLGWLGGSIANLFSGILQYIVFVALIVGVIYLTIKCGPVVCVQCGKGFKRLKVHHEMTIVVVDDEVPLEQVTQGTSQG